MPVCEGEIEDDDICEIWGREHDESAVCSLDTESPFISTKSIDKNEPIDSGEFTAAAAADVESFVGRAWGDFICSSI